LRATLITLCFDLADDLHINTRGVEAEAGSGRGGCGPFSLEAEAQNFYRFRFHIGYLP